MLVLVTHALVTLGRRTHGRQEKQDTDQDFFSIHGQRVFCAIGEKRCMPSLLEHALVRAKSRN